MRVQRMKSEIEDLKRDCDLTNGDLSRLQRTHDKAESEKLKLEEEFQMSQRKCEELNEGIMGLIKEQKESSDREKRAEERYAKVLEEHAKTTKEKKKSIFELTKEIKELKNKNSESERLYQEKLKELETKLLKMGFENEELRSEKATVEDLKRRESETNQNLERLKHQYLEATQQLRLEKEESDKVAEYYKMKCRPRLEKLEQEVANIYLKVKPEEIGNIVDKMEKHAINEEENVNFPERKREKVISGDGNDQEDAEDLVEKGAHGRRQRMFGAECSNKLTSPVADNIIEISDSDDETNPSGSAKGTNVGKNETVFGKLFHTPSSNQTNKRSRTDDKVDLTTKKTRNKDMLPVDEKEITVHESTANKIGLSLSKDFSKACDSPTSSGKVNGLVDSTDSDDESCSDSHMNNLVSTLRSKTNSLMP